MPARPNSKLARRQRNFGKRNTVRRTKERKMLGMLEHRPPADLKNDDGGPWMGFSRRNPRKPFRIEPSWRVWMKQDGIRRWRIRRAIALATAELAELERAA